ncbi:MAG: gcdC, partial [Firmicutes bacterium]|nr:gcdC [Bacillota bacterium]
VSAGDTPVNAPMPGKVTKIVASVGQNVKKGEIILILEAMKMQNEIGSPADGTVKSINVTAGQSVKPGEVMAVIG